MYFGFVYLSSNIIAFDIIPNVVQLLSNFSGISEFLVYSQK